MPKFASQIDAQRIPIKGLVPESGTAFPGTPTEGMLFHRTDLKEGYQYLNGAWQKIAPTGAPSAHTHNATEVYYAGGTSLGASTVEAALDSLDNGLYLHTMTTDPGSAHGATSIAFAPTGNLSATNVNAALVELDNEKAPSTHTHASSQVTHPAGAIVSAGTVETALQELDTWANLHEGYTSGEAHPASGIWFSPSGNIAATTVQAAIAELDTEKVGIAGNVTITGTKTFSTAPVVPDNSFAIAKVSGLQGALDSKADITYVDAISQGFTVKPSVRVATTANITLSGTQTIDGVAVVAGDRVLVKNQTTASQNGIYVVAAGAWTRAADFDTSADVTKGSFVFVQAGTSQDNSGWVMTNDAAPTLGTDAINWEQFSGTGQITAGAGLTKTGNTIDVVGTANRITANADSIDIASTYVGQTSITTLGTIATGTWNATTIAVNKGGTGATDAATARTNLGVLADQAAGTASMRTLGTGATQAAAGSHGHALTDANITGVLPIAQVPTGTTSTTVALGNHTHALTDAAITGTLTVAKGGTGATTAAAARTNLSAAGAFSVTYASALTAGTWSSSINHGLGSDFVDVTFIEVSTGENIVLDWKRIDSNNVQIRADLAFAANALRILVTSK